MADYASGCQPGAGFRVFVGLFWYGFWVSWRHGPEFSPPRHCGALAYGAAGSVCGLFVLAADAGVVGEHGLFAGPSQAVDLPRAPRAIVPGRPDVPVPQRNRMLLALTGGAIGLPRNPARVAWLRFRELRSPCCFIVFNVLLASGTRSLLERLLARRKVRELVALLLAMVWVLPRFLMTTGIRPTWLHSAGRFAGHFGWPWSAAAHAAVPLGIPSTEYLVSWLSLGFWTLLAGWYGRAQFERNLRYDSLAAQATPLKPVSERTLRWTDRFYRVPSLIWSVPLAAIVEKELRTLARSARFAWCSSWALPSD